MNKTHITFKFCYGIFYGKTMFKITLNNAKNKKLEQNLKLCFLSLGLC